MKKKYSILAAIMTLPAIFVGFSFTQFTQIPENAVPVKNFEQQRYLGTWYEIARLDYKWERNLDHVTATYSLKNNGSIKVDNKGFDVKKNKWKQSIGKAKPASDPKTGSLKVSFFGPFYSGYNIIALDSDYKYALVIGESTNYLWILSREKTIPDHIKQNYTNQAKALGVKTNELVWVNQS